MQGPRELPCVTAVLFGGTWPPTPLSLPLSVSLRSSQAPGWISLP